RPFVGKSTASTIAAILSFEPAPLDVAPFRMSRMFERAVRKCLAKNPEDRWQNVEDLKSELEWVRESTADTVDADAPDPGAIVPRAKFRIALAVMLLALLVGSAVFGLRGSPLSDSSEAGVVRFYSYPPRGNREIYFGLKSELS